MPSTYCMVSEDFPEKEKTIKSFVQKEKADLYLIRPEGSKI
jgi:hypothetical protein